MPSTPSVAVAALSLLGLSSATPLKPRQAPSTYQLAATNNYLPLTSVKTTNASLNTGAAARFKKYGHQLLRDLGVEEEWAAKVNFGGEEVFMILDTGSSDTWLAQKGFQCVNVKGKNQPEADCSFGPVYNGTFTDGKIAGENFNISYGDGEFLTGNLGYTDVTIGGIHVTNQTVALVTKAYWEGDSTTSGLMGLAYSALTSAFEGTDPTKDNQNVTGTAPGDHIVYSPIIETMIAQGMNPPIFSMALQRSSNEAANVPGGYIAFGGLPPVNVDPSDFVTTPILAHEFLEYPPLDASLHGFYTIKPDGYFYSSKPSAAPAHHSTTIDAIVDSGTTLLYVPTPVYTGYIASFSPAATLDQGSYFYPCNATAPEFGIKIAGMTFNVSSADILLPDSGYKNKTSGVEYCLIGVQDGGAGAYAQPIFGDVFMKNVVIVFDQQANTMQIAQHVY